MSGIFGLLDFEPQASPAAGLARMDQAMAAWGPDGGGTWHDPWCGLGQRLLYNTPEALHERMPRWVEEAGLAFTVEARLDNREELCGLLGIPSSDRPTTPDGDLALGAYLRWGEACPDRLLGDWSLAAWHPRERRLFLARDHHGNTGLRYWGRGTSLAFASDARALHAVGAPRRLNELYLAQVLVSWTAWQGPQTIDLDIHRLPPAHAMVVTPEGTRTWRYWRLEDAPELRLSRRQDYVEGLREVYGEAVRCRLRSHRPVGVTLSGGLDSGSVAALAARELARQGRRLAAFTSVPVHDTAGTVGPNRFGDETALASATATSCGNVDHHLVDCARVTPLEGIRRALKVQSEPAHAAANLYWLGELLDQARGHGVGTLLTGQGGNASVSWIGAPALRSPLGAFRLAGWKEGLRLLLPSWLARAWLSLRASAEDWSGSSLHPDFARRLRLAELRARAVGRSLTHPSSRRSPRDRRLAILGPGASPLGEVWAGLGAACGLEVRDPTVDRRVLEWTLGVPDSVFDGPDGADRWLIREAMEGLLPDPVRLCRRRGRQAADLAGRLMASAAEVEAALAEVDAAPANRYLEVEKLRRAWDEVRGAATPLSTHRAVTILLRGLMAGIFLNGLEGKES